MSQNRQQKMIKEAQKDNNNNNNNNNNKSKNNNNDMTDISGTIYTNDQKKQKNAEIKDIIINLCENKGYTEAQSLIDNLDRNLTEPRLKEYYYSLIYYYKAHFANRNKDLIQAIKYLEKAVEHYDNIDYHRLIYQYCLDLQSINNGTKYLSEMLSTSHKFLLEAVDLDKLNTEQEKKNFMDSVLLYFSQKTTHFIEYEQDYEAAYIWMKRWQRLSPTYQLDLQRSILRNLIHIKNNEEKYEEASQLIIELIRTARTDDIELMTTYACIRIENFLFLKEFNEAVIFVKKLIINWINSAERFQNAILATAYHYLKLKDYLSCRLCLNVEHQIFDVYNKNAKVGIPYYIEAICQILEPIPESENAERLIAYSIIECGLLLSSVSISDLNLNRRHLTEIEDNVRKVKLYLFEKAIETREARLPNLFIDLKWIGSCTLVSNEYSTELYGFISLIGHCVLKNLFHRISDVANRWGDDFDKFIKYPDNVIFKLTLFLAQKRINSARDLLINEVNRTKMNDKLIASLAEITFNFGVSYFSIGALEVCKDILTNIFRKFYKKYQLRQNALNRFNSLGPTYEKYTSLTLACLFSLNHVAELEEFTYNLYFLHKQKYHFDIIEPIMGLNQRQSKMIRVI
jgi:hypothetical protein